MGMVEGEILPSGIDVDETSAYFGITASAEIVETLRALSPSDALCRFIEATADLILPGPIDLFAIAERLGCEGGEIYYLMADTFGLIQQADPMRRYVWLAPEGRQEWLQAGARRLGERERKFAQPNHGGRGTCSNGKYPRQRR